MTSCQYQQALGKSLIALLTVTLLAMAGCGDKPQDNPPSNESNQTPVTAATPEQSPQPDSNNAVTTDAPNDDSQAVTDPQQEDQNQAGSVSESPADEQDTQAAAVKPEPETEKLSAEAGKELYEKQCKVCHEAGLLNAPKYGDKAAWQPHISKGIETLYEHSAKGFNKMPPQATNGVTEAQVHAAVDYMVAGSS